MYGSSYHAHHQPYYKAALAGPAGRPPPETHSQAIPRGSSSSSSSLSSAVAAARKGRRSNYSSMRRPVERVLVEGGGVKLKVHVDDVLDDWDSDPELETAQIREASRVRRGHVVARQHNSGSSSSSGGSSGRRLENELPFYSTVVEPAMALGQQWPPRPAQPRGFQRYQSGYKVPPLHEPQQRPKPLYSLTVHLNDTYKRHHPEFQYDTARSNPKRILTKPSKPAKNDGYDNEDHDYILRVNDVLGEEKEYQYRVIDLLGQGTFGQVVKCERVSTGQLFSVKVIKNKPAYRNQSRMEVEIVKELKQKLDAKNHHHLLQLHHTFNHKNHLCLVFELLSFNLYELIKQNDFKGLSLNLVRVFALQLLDTLTLLKDANVIHCDLKPENVLLKSPESPTIKVIDFGSACLETRQMYEYIQSRFYRSPEVLLGLPYTSAIDMWSFGCIVAELFIGIPLFPGSSEYNQLRRIVDMLGNPPQSMLDKGKKTLQFFNREAHTGGKQVYRLKSREQYSKEHGRNELPSKQYFRQRDLPSLILEYNPGPKAMPIMDEQERKRDIQTRHALVNFLEGVLQLDPLTRWTPRQARYHPFITGEPYVEPYKPEKHMKSAMRHEAASSASSQNGAHVPNNARVTSPKENNHTGAHRSRARSMGVPTIPSHIQELAQDIQAQPVIRSTKDADSNNGRKLRPGPMPIVETIPVAATQQQQGEQPRVHRHTRSHGNVVGLLPPEVPRTIKATTGSTITSSDTTLAPSDSSSVEKHTVFIENNALVPIISGSQSEVPQATRKVKIAPMLKVRFGSRDSLRMADEVHVKKGEADWLVETQSKPKRRLAHAGEAAGGLLLMRQENPEEVTNSSGKKMAAALKRRSLLSSSNSNNDSGNM